jgi:hypothetical protein
MSWLILSLPSAIASIASSLIFSRSRWRMPLSVAAHLHCLAASFCLIGIVTVEACCARIHWLLAFCLLLHSAALAAILIIATKAFLAARRKADLIFASAAADVPKEG